MKKIISKIIIILLIIASHTPLSCQTIKQGNVIILSGTSTAGKSSIAQCLPQLLHEPYEQIAFDDFLTHVFLEQITSPLPYQEFLERIHLQIGIMYDHTKERAFQGKNVLVDTVLSALEGEKDVQFALEKLQGLTITALVLVYCPLPVLAKRIKQRNETALLHNKPEDIRSITYVKFNDLFQIQTSPDQIALDTLSREDIEHAYAVPPGASEYEIQQLHSCKTAILTHFDLIKKESVTITPCLDYDCIINTTTITPEQAARQIYDCIVSYNLCAFKKNYEKFLLT